MVILQKENLPSDRASAAGNPGDAPTRWERDGYDTCRHAHKDHRRTGMMDGAMIDVRDSRARFDGGIRCVSSDLSSLSRAQRWVGRYRTSRESTR